jgi:hypothetical protein
MSADLKVTGEFLNLKASRDADWIDPTIGLQYNRPFAGYRLIAFDYEEGSGRSYQRYDLTEQGPLVGVSISF